jgi:hypothetical protein
MAGFPVFVTLCLLVQEPPTISVIIKLGSCGILSPAFLVSGLILRYREPKGIEEEWTNAPWDF